MGETIPFRNEKKRCSDRFFSWHAYRVEPAKIKDKAIIIKNILIENGYDKTESILNEWNYVNDWGTGFVKSVMTIHGIKGAAFVMASMTEMQKCDALDMLMYYDTRPSAFCGAFDYYTYEPLKGYYPLMWYGKFYDMESEVRCEKEPENIYTLCGIDKEGKSMCIITNYSDDEASAKKLKLTLAEKVSMKYI